MIVSILVMMIGAMILAASLYYFIKEKGDPDSKKIYGTMSAVGGAICLVGIIALIVRYI